MTGRTVILRHDLPDGSHHFDWMLERAPGAALLTFRLGAPVDTTPQAPFHGVRLADHRREYLDYEGPVSGGRGRVKRVSAGECRISAESAGEIRLEIDLGAGWQRLRGRAEGGDRWVFSPDR